MTLGKKIKKCLSTSVISLKGALDQWPHWCRRQNLGNVVRKSAQRCVIKLIDSVRNVTCWTYVYLQSWLFHNFGLSLINCSPVQEFYSVWRVLSAACAAQWGAPLGAQPEWCSASLSGAVYPKVAVWRLLSSVFPPRLSSTPGSRRRRSAESRWPTDLWRSSVSKAQKWGRKKEKSRASAESTDA